MPCISTGAPSSERSHASTTLPNPRKELSEQSLRCLWHAVVPSSTVWHRCRSTPPNCRLARAVRVVCAQPGTVVCSQTPLSLVGAVGGGGWGCWWWGVGSLKVGQVNVDSKVIHKHLSMIRSPFTVICVTN